MQEAYLLVGDNARLGPSVHVYGAPHCAQLLNSTLSFSLVCVSDRCYLFLSVIVHLVTSLSSLFLSWSEEKLSLNGKGRLSLMTEQGVTGNNRKRGGGGRAEGKKGQRKYEDREKKGYA